MDTQTYELRPAGEADLPAILDIYNDAILNTTATFDIEPKTLDERRIWFAEIKHPHCVIVAESEGEVVGFGALLTFHTRAAYRFTAQDSVYIHPEWKGQGAGTVLLAGVIEIAGRNGFHTIMAGISQDNPASERLHARFGFQFVGTEREVGYKFERWLDVGWWQLML